MAMKSTWWGLAVGLVTLLLGAPPVEAQQSGLLVEAAWLNARLSDRQIRIVDMVTEPGDYRRGHIPGAVYRHVDDSRIGVPAGGFRLPNAEEGAKLLGSLGITPETQVVIYDDTGGLHASRLFFTLDVLRHRKAADRERGVPAG